MLDYGQLAWLVLPQFPYLESGVQVVVLGIGEVKIFQTHPICSSSLQHMQRDDMSLRFFWNLDWGGGIGNHGKRASFWKPVKNPQTSLLRLARIKSGHDPYSILPYTPSLKKQTPKQTPLKTRAKIQPRKSVLPEAVNALFNLLFAHPSLSGAGQGGTFPHTCFRKWSEGPTPFCLPHSWGRHSLGAPGLPAYHTYQLTFGASPSLGCL